MIHIANGAIKSLGLEGNKETYKDDILGPKGMGRVNGLWVMDGRINLQRNKMSYTFFKFHCHIFSSQQRISVTYTRLLHR